MKARDCDADRQRCDRRQNRGCALVTRTPDGFLNLRKFPTPSSEIVAQLYPGDDLDIVNDQCRGFGDEDALVDCQNENKGSWTHVIGVSRLNRLDYLDRKRPRVHAGWARSRYIEITGCDNDIGAVP